MGLIDKNAAIEAIEMKIKGKSDKWLQDICEMNGLKIARSVIMHQKEVDAAKIAKLCNDIEDEVTDIAFNSTHHHIFYCCQAIRDILKEIGKELTVNVRKPD